MSEQNNNGVQTDAVFGPYSPIYETGTLVFVSGQVGVDAATGEAPADVVQQTHQAMQNVQKQLELAGLSLREVVKTTVYTTMMAEYKAINEAYQKYFRVPRPARALVGVAELPPVGGSQPVKIEIEAIAARGAGERT